mgnify:CR=1 FL=1
MFFFKSYVASYGYVRRPGTDRIPEGVPKKFPRNRNHDSCEKSATGEENTGILRIPAGITNLACRLLIPACLHTILYHLLFLHPYHSLTFETHVGLCPHLLTFSLANTFDGSPTRPCRRQMQPSVAAAIRHRHS